jgi:class 3 adenylate cyclase/pimeloyl-ACP methyl ester carboxylesterase
MEQQIRFCATKDGVRIAYATVGEGPPLVYVCGWPQHLELEWESPFSRGFLDALTPSFTLVRYDMRGSGLSDRQVEDFSLEALTRDLEAVVDHLALETVILMSLGTLAGPIAMTYVAAHPERVSHLVLQSSFLRGEKIVPPEQRRVLVEYASNFGFPMGGIDDQPLLDSREEEDHVRRMQKAAVDPGTQGALLRTMFEADVTAAAQKITVPALVMHSRNDRQIPFELGREVAAVLPNARFVPFEAKSQAVWTFQDKLLSEMRPFVGVEAAEAMATADRQETHTILFTDVVGHTEMMQRLGDEKGRELLREHERITREVLRSHGGTEVKTMGDGFMASFGSATRALECAIALQRAFEERNETAEEPVRVRVGLNAGEPIAEEDDLFGTAVILAARIAAKADGGEILTSETVRGLVAGKKFLFADRGETVLRGFEDAVRLYGVSWQAHED